ncbi:hypothetical protein QKW60_03215 [Defluviimonas aestuarii]|uniref:hypothetical protein n=1 Tax=Albidovulum aestuarii TaxID=1130726 RepID=UPI00249BE58D|nr:hypothetical protein [Defluviimonas aestuarii]MDI3335405.1 hypothetical protein [Defluviimonas aestuarii]
MQQLFVRHQARLRQAGVAFWGPDVMRSAGLKDFVSSHVAGQAPLTGLANARAALALHVRTAHGCGKVVISDENLAGAMRVNYAQAALYPDALVRLSAVAELVPEQPSAIFVTIRDFAGYWRSVHAHLALRGVVRGSIDSTRLAASEGNSWLPFLRAVRTVFADTPINVMHYENAIVGRLSAAMLGHMLTVDMQAGTTGNASLGPEALADIAAVPAGPARTARIAAHRKAAKPLNNPFSAAETARLSTAYESDWAALRKGEITGVTAEPEFAAEGVE